MVLFLLESWWVGTDNPCPVFLSVVDAIFGCKVMVTVPVVVLVCVVGVPINRCYDGVVGFWVNKGVQEMYGTIVSGSFCGELDVRINSLRVDVLEELVTMFSLLDDKSVILFCCTNILFKHLGSSY